MDRKSGWRLITVACVVIFLGLMVSLTLREVRQAENKEAYGEQPGARKQVMAEAMREATPHQLGGLERSEVVQGAKAVTEIARLHGKSFDLTSGTVARYDRNGTDATLWVGETPNPKAAADMIRQMTEGIRAGRSPFKGLEEINADGRAVYALSGMGQRHVYFADGNRTVWAAADSAIFGHVLEDLLTRYPGK